MLLKRLSAFSVLYLLVLLFCLAAIFQVTSNINADKDEVSALVERVTRTQLAILKVSQLTADIQGAVNRILLNDSPEDVAAEMEKINKWQAEKDGQLKGLMQKFSTLGFENEYDSLLSLERNLQIISKEVLAPDNLRAVHLYYDSFLPVYDQHQSLLLNVNEDFYSKILDPVKGVELNMKKRDRFVLLWLGLSVITICSGIIFVVSRESKIWQIEQEQNRYREQIEIEELRRGLRGHEQDRNLIGKELHDNINQQLGVIKLSLAVALDEPGKHEKLVTRCITQVNDVIEIIRVLSRGLVNPLNQHLSLKSSITELVQSFKDVKPNIEFDMYLEEPEEEKYITPELKVNIFRIVQEQMNNIIKHSNASLVNIYLTYDMGELTLTIEDNGLGVEVDAKKSGIGLSNIYQRARAFSGSAEIVSSPGKGFTLTVRFPC